MKKLDPMEFWFMEWLMNEKEYTMETYAFLTQEDIEQLEKEFISMYQAITAGEIK